MTKLVNMRMHVSSIEDLVDMVMAAARGESTEARTEVRWQIVHFLHGLEDDLAKGAARGIEEMLELIMDPKYHETLKLQRKRRREQLARLAAQEDWRRRRKPPTRKESTLVQ